MDHLKKSPLKPTLVCSQRMKNMRTAVATETKNIFLPTPRTKGDNREPPAPETTQLDYRGKISGKVDNTMKKARHTHAQRLNKESSLYAVYKPNPHKSMKHVCRAKHTNKRSHQRPNPKIGIPNYDFHASVAEDRCLSSFMRCVDRNWRKNCTPPTLCSVCGAPRFRKTCGLYSGELT